MQNMFLFKDPNMMQTFIMLMIKLLNMSNLKENLMLNQTCGM